jgi:LacI family transcriptional regulator
MRMTSTEVPREDLHSRVTIQDVARASGVSATTVSHVLTGKRPVAAATRERVEAAVRELDYRPNHAARNLRTRSSHMITVIVPDITNPFYSLLTRGLADAVGGDYGSYVCNTDGSETRERTFVADALARGVDGVVIASVDEDVERAASPTRFATPVVCLGESIDHPYVDRVIAADADGSRAATEHLIEQGSRRVGMIQGSRHSGQSRAEGYRQALEAAGHRYRPSLTVHGEWTRAGGRTAMLRLMRQKGRPDAVFCANDLMAIGAMDAARELGLSIPADVRLVGFDDIEAASLVSPGLSTVANPAYETGAAAGGLLLDRLLGRHTGGRRTVTLPCRLVLRQSS